MEDRDAHVSRIYCTLKSDSQKSYLVQLPPGFGKGEFAVGNSVFIRKVVHDVTGNGQAMIHALVSLQKDLEKFAQRWKESEERCVSMAKKCEDLQKELNDTRAAHNAQIQHNIELQKTLRQVETETHNLSLELQQIKDTEGKQRDRIQALTSHTTSLAERVSQFEAELEVARGETKSLVAKLALVKAKLCLCVCVCV
jgi:chromosome segregation ATPase